jgi:hypothetical protein
MLLGKSCSDINFLLKYAECKNEYLSRQAMMLMPVILHANQSSPESSAISDFEKLQRLYDNVVDALKAEENQELVC